MLPSSHTTSTSLPLILCRSIHRHHTGKLCSGSESLAYPPWSAMVS
ncbi:hypothetical protein ID866_11410 [Astraeus odoratus]|nr:hypothetical protein ID866_11410 [Astraeus odoratus]